MHRHQCSGTIPQELLVHSSHRHSTDFRVQRESAKDCDTGCPANPLRMKRGITEGRRIAARVHFAVYNGEVWELTDLQIPALMNHLAKHRKRHLQVQGGQTEDSKVMSRS